MPLYARGPSRRDQGERNSEGSGTAPSGQLVMYADTGTGGELILTNKTEKQLASRLLRSFVIGIACATVGALIITGALVWVPRPQASQAQAQSDLAALHHDDNFVGGDLRALSSDARLTGSDLAATKSDAALGTDCYNVSTVKIDATNVKTDASTVSIDLSTLTSDIGAGNGGCRGHQERSGEPHRQRATSHTGSHGGYRRRGQGHQASSRKGQRRNRSGERGRDPGLLDSQRHSDRFVC